MGRAMPVEALKKCRLKKGDIVSILSGKDKGKSGKILEINLPKGRLFVEKLNMLKKHTKPSQKQRQGGIIEKEGPVNISNVMVVCQSCGKPSRLGIRKIEDGTKFRFCKKCDEIIDPGK